MIAFLSHEIGKCARSTIDGDWLARYIALAIPRALSGGDHTLQTAMEITSSWYDASDWHTPFGDDQAFSTFDALQIVAELRFERAYTHSCLCHITLLLHECDYIIP